MSRPFLRALLALAALYATTSALAEKSRAIIEDVAYLQPQSLVALEPGRRLNLYCTGNGKPTVVFDAGLGDSSSSWGLN